MDYKTILSTLLCGRSPLDLRTSEAKTVVDRFWNLVSPRIETANVPEYVKTICYRNAENVLSEAGLAYFA